MKTRVKACLAACAAALITGVGGPSVAHNATEPGKAGELANLTEAANLVVLGTVADVRYVNAVDRQTGALVPHTFVTYRVEQTFRGKPTEQSLTLRFLGGPDGQGRFLAVSGVPKFQPGERDLLFVLGSGERSCALALCEYGRFRVLGDRVYNTYGSPVRALVKNNVISRGAPPTEFLRFAYPAPTLDGLLQNPEVRKLLEEQDMDLDDVRKRYESEAPKTIQLNWAAGPETQGAAGEADAGGQPKPPGRRPVARNTPQGLAVARSELAARAELLAVAPPRGQTAVLPEGPIALQQFVEVVERLSREAKRSPEPVRNADPKAEIKLSSIRALAPPAERRLAREAAPFAATASVATAQNAQDAAEEAALRANDFNPVLPR